MKDLEQRKAAKEFVERWKGKGYEKGQSQQFWTDLLENVYGISNAATFIEFEDQVHIDKATGFIDAYIPETKILIEQKSLGKNLRQAIKQSDGSLLNPFQQAKRYIVELDVDRHPKYVITCNFESFLVYDMHNPNGEPEEIFLKDLGKEYYRLSFIVDSKNEHLKKEEEISFKAGELVGKLYDAFSKEYINIDNEQSQKDLNELCVRLVFCLYAEDAGLFGRKNVFHDYLAKYEDLTQMRKALIDLFKILDTKLENRDPYLEDDLNQFPYVNGGLFSNENIEIPKFTEEIRTTLLAKASDEFDWSEISPTIFGAVFESTLNPETRRSGGMHYTSIENIHKVIDPLFLDELREKLNEAESYKNEKIRNDKLVEFQNYISTLNFFDPACGSGNFLTETYLSLRRLENEALSVMSNGMMILDIDGMIKVSIQQFFGIEINDFAAKVAKTALWIAEAQMWTETKKIISSLGDIGDFLPLNTYNNILEGNALRIDWNDVIPNTKCNYIMGNPPFIGARLMTESQKSDVSYIFKDIKNCGNVDYVGCWYIKSAEYMKNTNIQTALVSTNSICQGEQPAIVWKSIMENGIIINFAHKTFIWDSEASLKAHVHCVIVGFSYFDRKEKMLFENNIFKKVKHINAYLIEADNIFIENRSTPICNVSKMDFGSMPNDNGYLSNYSKEQKDEICSKYPNATKFFKKIFGAEEFINNKVRYCIWLKDENPKDYLNITPIMDAIHKVRENRLASTREATKKLSDIPHLFGEIRQPNSDYLLVPSTSSERRRYIPIGFQTKEEIATNANLVIPNATLYEFSILTSNVHMAWMRAVAGRLKSDYRYSAKIVYNNFPWPEATEEQKLKLEQTAQAILDARNKYSDSSLADMYGENMYLYPELLKAHQENDKAVMEVYGFNWRNMTESDCVAKLMDIYKKLIEKK